MPPEHPRGSSSPLNELEERLARLEQALLLDQLQPSYLTLDPTGHVGANLTGHVHAQGLDLDAGTGNTPPDQDRIRWLRTSDGAVVADLFAYEAGVDGFMAEAVLQGGQSAIANLNATPVAGTLGAELYAQYDPANAQFRRVVASAGGAGFTIIDGNGLSSFLQLAAAAQRALFLAQTVGLVFTASAKAAEVAIAHNLGRVPQAILVTPLGDPGVVLAPYAKNGGSTTTANIGAYTTAAISATKTVSVAIIG